MTNETEYAGGEPLPEEGMNDLRAEPQMEEGEPVPGKKPAKWLPMVVGGGFLVFAAGMAYLQFRPTSAPVDMPPMDMAPPASLAVSGVPLPETSLPPLAPLAETGDYPQAPAASVSDVAVPEMPAVLAGDVEAPVEEIAPASAVAGFPDVQALELPPVVAPTPIPAIAPAAANAAVDAKLAELDARIQEMSAKLAEVDTLKASLQDLQNRMQAGPVVAKPAEPVREVEVAKPEAVKKPVAAKTAKKKTAKWELRSVAADAAWVGEVGKPDVKRVVVGDTLEGVGTITSIHKVDGMWVVEGSKGTLRP